MNRDRTNTPGNEISTRNVLNAIMKYRGVVLAIPICWLMLALVYLWVTPYSYTATLIVTPVSSSGSVSSGLNGRLGGLASMAGFNLGAGGNESFDLYLSGLTSHLAAERLAKDPAFMHTLFAGQWSEKDHAWHKPSSIVAPVKDAVKGFLGLHVAAWKPPDADAVESFLFHHVTVTQDRQTQIVTITLDYTDREWARKILAELHSTVDGILRTRALERANQMIGYLQERLQTITVSDYREALIQTLSDQEKVRMMASSNLAYVAETFGEATVSPEPTSPKAGFILALSALVGVFLGILVGMFLDRHGDSAADKLDLLKAHKNQSVFWVRIATLLGIYLRSGRAG